MLQQH